MRTQLGRLALRVGLVLLVLSVHWICSSALPGAEPPAVAAAPADGAAPVSASPDPRFSEGPVRDVRPRRLSLTRAQPVYCLPMKGPGAQLRQQ